MDFRKETRGENSTRGIDGVISFYDNGVAPDKKDPSKIGVYFGAAYAHPDSAIGKDQTNLALLTERKEVTGEDGKSATKYNHSVGFYPEQMEAIKAAAGDNVSPLLDEKGVRRGWNYGVKFDAMSVRRNGKNVGFMPNTKTLAPSELSVAEVDGKTINQRIFEAAQAAREAREARKVEHVLRGGETQPQAQVETEPEMA